MYQGDIRLGETIDFKFLTAAAATGAPTTLAGTPVLSAYVGNSTTQITAGITLTVDFDGVTGLHNCRVVATSGNGYATATNVDIVITTGTVGGTSAVGYIVGSFSIENRSALMPTVAARTFDVAAGGEGGLDWANMSGTTSVVNLTQTKLHTGGILIDWSSIQNPTATVALTGTTLGLLDNAITAAKVNTAALTAAKFGAGAIDAAALAADASAEIVAAVKAMVVETNGTITLGQAMSIILAFAAGVSSGQATTSPVFEDPSGTDTRITGTTDGSGNRSAVTLTPSA